MFKKRPLIFFLVFFLALNTVKAQQSPMLSQNMFSHAIINPAFTAINQSIYAMAVTRQQWAGLTDSEGNHISPVTNIISVIVPSSFLNGGLGLSLAEDKLGFYKDVSANFHYGYKIDLSNGVLGIGGQLSVVNRNIDFSKFIPIDGNDPILSGNSNNVSSMMADIGLGVYYQVPKKFNVGFSIINLFETKGNSSLGTSTGQPVLDRTIYLTGGYEYELPNKPEFRLLPSVLVRSNFSSTQISISSLLQYNNKFWGGITYNVQTADAISILLGFQSNNFRIGYAYDLPLSSINPAGSHELMVSYCFDINFDKRKDSYRNTRFL